MTAFSLRRLPIARSAAAVLAILVGAGSAIAQQEDCEALRQRMAALSQADPNREARFAHAIVQQRTELARTQAYSDQIGCGGLSGLFGAAPPQCDGIADRIARMQSNLDTLQAQAERLRNGDPDRAADLAARYDASCRTDPDGGAAVYADPGFTQDGTPSILDEGAPQRPQGGSKAICVRTCDGGYFPLASAVNGDALDALQALCSAQCPNTEAKLYTTNSTDDIADAVALDGSPYTALPAAFRFTKSHEAACTCKPPNQTWAQALVKAEQMLDTGGTRDVTVTEQMSADMARPVPVTPKPAGKRTSRRGGLDLPPPALPDAVQLGALGAQAPTASSASAGIAAGAAPAAPLVRVGEGTVTQMPGPDGTTRRVRKVGPGL